MQALEKTRVANLEANQRMLYLERELAAERAAKEFLATQLSAAGQQRTLLDAALAEADAAVAVADEACIAADAAIKTTLREELLARKRVAVGALADAMLAARPMVDALVSIENDEADKLGPQPERLSAAWSSLMTSKETSFTPLLDFWLAAVTNYGLLDAKAK